MTSWTSSGGKSPCSTTPGVPASRAASAARVADLSPEVGDHAPVGASRHVAQLDRVEPSQGRGEPEGDELDRDGGLQRGDGLRAVGDDDETIGGGCDDLLARVCRAASLDEPAVGRDLVGAVDRQVEPVDGPEVLDVQPELSRGGLRSRRGRDATKRQPAPRDRGQQEGDGRAGAEAERHPVLDQLGGRLGGELLLGLVAHARNRTRAAFPLFRGSSTRPTAPDGR